MNTKRVLIPLLAGAISVTGCAPTSKTTQESRRPYPLKTCIVSGNTLGSMGDPITEVYEGRQIKFCCEPCVKKFHQNPQRYLKKLSP